MTCLRSRASEFWSFGVWENWRIGGAEERRIGGVEDQRSGVNQSLLEVGDGVEVRAMEDRQSWGSGLGVP